jgi:hypothetical protein
MNDIDDRAGSPEFERLNGRNFYPTIDQERAEYDARFHETGEAPKKEEPRIIDATQVIEKSDEMIQARKERDDIIDDRWERSR